ncbi:MAG: dUTP diphosphatase [bacterium]
MSNPLSVEITRLDAAKTADVPLPTAMSVGAAGMDVYAAVESKIVVQSGETVAVPTGFAIAVPHGYEAQIRPRSGLALKHSVGLMNSPGTIDSDYRGEVRIILTNFGVEPFTIRRGDRIAQMVIAPVVAVAWKEVDRLPGTDRGVGGFGHTGI